MQFKAWGFARFCMFGAEIKRRVPKFKGTKVKDPCNTTLPIFIQPENRGFMLYHSPYDTACGEHLRIRGNYTALVQPQAACPYRAPHTQITVPAPPQKSHICIYVYCSFGTIDSKVGHPMSSSDIPGLYYIGYIQYVWMQGIYIPT